MKLNIILRTCDQFENNPDMTRIIKVSRTELIWRCLNSLITSINNVVSHHYIKLTVIDNSRETFRKVIQKCLTHCRHETKFLYIPSTNNESMQVCYDYALKNCLDVLYFVEDDYLHFPHSLPEMIETYDIFKACLGQKEVAIHPADSPLEYMPEYIYPCRVVLSQYRHWRTSVSSSFALMLSKGAFLNHYDKFERYAKFDGVNYHEANTINLMFIDDVTLFSPIPTLAFHLGYINPPAPHIDYLPLWESSDRIKGVIDDQFLRGT